MLENTFSTAKASRGEIKAPEWGTPVYPSASPAPTVQEPGLHFQALPPSSCLQPRALSLPQETEAPSQATPRPQQQGCPWSCQLAPPKSLDGLTGEELSLTIQCAKPGSTDINASLRIKTNQGNTMPSDEPKEALIMNPREMEVWELPDKEFPIIVLKKFSERQETWKNKKINSTKRKQ